MEDTFLSATWENLVMANYEVNPDVLMPYLPNGVELDFYEGKTYVSLVGFMFKNTSLFNIPVPFLGTFEEINLRFYVRRVEEDSIKRGVVFINETVPYKPVAWLANILYKEHYIAIPTKNSIEQSGNTKKVRYEWKINTCWNHIEVSADVNKTNMETVSIEEFIFEHYFGYTKLNEIKSQEYKVNHPRWQVNKIHDYTINCDFKSMYGKYFSYLTDEQPDSVIMAEGSQISVNWKRAIF